MLKSWPINDLLQMLKFGIMLYLVPNLAPCIAFAKFNAKFDIALENIFMSKCQILTLAHKFNIALEMLLVVN